VSTTAANVSWKVSYDSTNPAQRDIPATCFEKTALSIDNNGRSPARDAGLRTPNQLHPVGPGNAGAHNVPQDRAIQPAHRPRAVPLPERQFVRPGHQGKRLERHAGSWRIPPNKSDLTRFYEASEVISGYPAQMQTMS